MDTLKEILTLDSNAKTVHFKKGKILQSAGANTDVSFFVKEGLLRSYTIDEKGKEHIFMFASKGWLIADIESQEFHQPAELFIDCLEDSEVVVFDKRCFKIANLTTDQLQRNTHLLSRRIAVLQRRVLMLMSASARERYEQFLISYPDLPNRVPQRMIASYLGVTPQALSTIRGIQARKK
ncbi:MAG: Crp/Fnr family transcriptional regulator [Saprospiraceae bacterium]|nr:Crp/Fnr family transcriptional regulator [Saprospiraceae bacterium]|tara:strand:- start:16452 stop:16991 length:540 start_codon:yes stop_codon:yes gene_type:complete